MSKITDSLLYQMIATGGSGGGGITPSGTKQITENGTHDVTQYASAEVDVPPYGEGSVNINTNGTHNVSGKATAEVNVPNPSTGTKQITTNGTHDVTDFASAQVAVPNTYAAADEGKVVDNGALVAQTSKNVSANGTVDTTTNNEVVVAVPPYGEGSVNINANGTHNVSGKASAVVAVPNAFEPSDYSAVDGLVFTLSLANLAQMRVGISFLLTQTGAAELVSVGDKVAFSGDVSHPTSGALLFHYHLWGTCTEIDANNRPKMRVDGMSLREHTAYAGSATANGRKYTNGMNYVDINVPNTYEAADEGKVVSNGALVAQTSKTVTANGTVDTTENNEVIVNVPSSGVSENWLALCNDARMNQSVALTDSDFPAANFGFAENALNGNTKIRSVTSNKVSSVGNYAFKESMIISFSGDNVTHVGYSAFNQSDLATLNVPNLTTAYDGAFQLCRSLSGLISLPELTDVPASMFQQSTIGGIYAPKARLFFSNPFYGCTQLLTAEVGTDSTVAATLNTAFSGCTSLETVELGNVTALKNGAFQNCYKLRYINFGGCKSIPTASSTYDFNNCGRDVEGGTILYVPDDFVAGWRTATNWATLVANGTITIKGVSEMPTA